MSEWAKWFEPRELFLDDGQVLARRFLFSDTGIVSFVELLDGEGPAAGWRLRLVPPLDGAYGRTCIDPAVAAELAGRTVIESPSCLEDYPAHLTDIPDDCMQRDRIEWTDRAVLATLAEIGRHAPSVREDLMMSSYEGCDYDYAIDRCTWFRHAFTTVAAMVDERELLISRELLRAKEDRG